MDICGEHGYEIAYMGRNCPACEQIEEINQDHNDAMKSAEDEFESEVSDMQDTIDGLQDQLENK